MRFVGFGVSKYFYNRDMIRIIFFINAIQRYYARLNVLCIFNALFKCRYVVF